MADMCFIDSAWTVAVVRFTYASVDLTAEDRTWIAGTTFFLSVLEVNTGLICGCTPALKPLIISARDTTLSWTRKYSTSGFSRKRSQPGWPHSDDTDRTDASGGKGFIELKPMDSDKSHNSADEKDRRPTYWQQGGQISYAPPAKAAASTPSQFSSARMPRNPGSDKWEGYSMASAGQPTPGRPAEVPHLTSEELFQGTGVPKPKGPLEERNVSWYTNEAV
ncbi:MAG: hypothetical protein Q9162_006648 [Coniocarpon cinnabarinum]